MEKEEAIKYAELIISMSTDFLLGKISKDHFIATLDSINSNIQKNNIK